jgi:hypothetical protein
MIIIKAICLTLEMTLNILNNDIINILNRTWIAANVIISSSVHSTSSVRTLHLDCSYSWLILISSTYTNNRYKWQLPTVWAIQYLIPVIAHTYLQVHLHQHMYSVSHDWLFRTRRSWISVKNNFIYEKKTHALDTMLESKIQVYTDMQIYNNSPTCMVAQNTISINMVKSGLHACTNVHCTWVFISKHGHR